MWSHCLRSWISVWDEKVLKINNSDDCTTQWIVPNATEPHLKIIYI